MSSTVAMQSVTQVLGLMLCVATACDQKPSPPKPMPASPSAPPVHDPNQLPPVEPAEGAASAQGLALEVDAAHAPAKVTLRNDGAATLVGQTTFRLVWTGAHGEARPWRAVGTLSRGCADPAVDPAHQHRGALGPGSSVTWDLPAGEAQYCAGTELRAMPLPAGSYRINATFHSEPAGSELVLWSMPFTLPR